MYDILVKTGLLSLRNIISYRIIGNTITETLREHVMDIDFIIPMIQNHNFHCISCIAYDALSTSMLMYILSQHVSGELDSIKRFDKITNLAKLRRLVGKTLWVILFVLTKRVENAI
jgi:hypothetical protein